MYHEFHLFNSIFLLSFRKPELKEAIFRAGYVFLSPVQKILPVLLADPAQSMVIQGHSGSGKTVAMAMLMLNRVNIEQNYPQIVCVTATAELAHEMTGKLLNLACNQPNLKIRQVVDGGNLHYANNVCQTLKLQIE